MGRLRFVVAGLAGLATVIAGAATAASFDALLATRWQWSEGVDPITDQKVGRAVLATTIIEDIQPGVAEARIALVCTAGKPRMLVDWSFKVAGAANLTVEYRFAGEPGRRLKARAVNRSSEEITDLGDLRRFLSDARRSDKLLLRVTSDAYGVNAATFRAAAGADIVRRFTAACPSAAPR